MDYITSTYKKSNKVEIMKVKSELKTSNIKGNKKTWLLFLKVIIC